VSDALTAGAGSGIHARLKPRHFLVHAIFGITGLNLTQTAETGEVIHLLNIFTRRMRYLATSFSSHSSSARFQPIGILARSITPMSELKKYSDMRKVFLINPKFQLAFMAWMVGISISVVLVYHGANWYFFQKFHDQGIALGLPPDHVFFEFLRDQQRAMFFIFLGTAAAVFSTVCTIGLILSHRVAGPLYRLNRHMLDVAEGKTTNNVKFRTKDHFQEIAHAYNLQMERYRKAVGAPDHNGNKNKAA
jgi:methyl-accepting chemotaxis protein